MAVLEDVVDQHDGPAAAAPAAAAPAAGAPAVEAPAVEAPAVEAQGEAQGEAPKAINATGLACPTRQEMEFVDTFLIGKLSNDPLAKLHPPKMQEAIEAVLKQSKVFSNQSLITSVLSDLAVNYR